ncbi:hypothetical protein Hanom_Chr06g00560721 [Helianthus anomalus]
MEISGLDSNGRQFKNPNEMWQEEVGDSQKSMIGTGTMLATGKVWKHRWKVCWVDMGM